MSPPAATYRLQLHAGFDLDAAAAVVPYLARLGISHVYTSPILQAVAGSTHGYDVVDHSRISDELGGAAAFDRLVAALREAGMGLVVDIVPNHMAIGPANAWWWDVLRHGQGSRHAGYFDVDWDSPEARLRNVILLPVLADHYGRVLEAGGLRLERRDGELVVVHGEQPFPLDPATVDAVLAAASDDALAALNADVDRLDALLEAQNYRLAFWRAGSRDLGYRRFFDIDTLVGLRVEEPEVFEATHRLILDRVAAGDIGGLRVDHPDGLRDPAAYFARLREAAPNAWIVAEKILEGHEELRDWPIDGTTGYRFANLATGLQVDPAAEGPMTQTYGSLADADIDWAAVAVTARRQALTEQLGSDLNRLTALWLSVCESNRRYRDFTRHELHEALRELAAAFEVYRTYVRPESDGPADGVADADRAVIAEAVATAERRRPDLDPELFGFLAAILRLEVPGEGATELAMRFQQLTPAAMAKGIEDSAFYRYLRLVALNEVGGDPGSFGTDPGAFHAALAHEHEAWPRAMLSTSTHDTKRSEDVRARQALLAERPDEWRRTVEELSAAAAPHRPESGLPGAKVEYLLFQTLLGAWPLSVDRCLAYMEKATREAKEQTSWTSPDPDFDEALAALVRGCLGDPAFVAAIERAVAPLVATGRVNSLAQLLWKLTAPGVPDTYQGTELWDLSLVDPDNRRPVDFDLRRRLLDELDRLTVAQVMARADEGLPKLWLTHHALALRARRPDDLGPAGAYRPLAAIGPAAEHVVAYARGQEVVAVAPRLPLRLEDAGGWRDTRLPVAAGSWRNVLTDTAHTGPELALNELLHAFPVALLEHAA